jgi:proteic killer suppression protein
MIESFRHRGLKRLFQNGEGKGVSPQFVDRVENILGLLDAATRVQDMALPSFRLHMSSGNLRGYWSVTVRANWRIIFRFEDGNAHDVDLIDYH